MRRSPLLLFLLALAAFSVLIIDLLLPTVLPRSFSDRPVSYLRDWAIDSRRPIGQSDSWKPMIAAYRYVTSGVSEPVYEALFFREKLKFQYPPSGLLLLLPFQHPDEGQSSVSLTNNLNRMSWWIFPVIPLLAAAIFLLQCRGKEPIGFGEKWVAGLLLVSLGLFFYPNLRAYHIGQIQLWLNGLVALILVLWLLGGKVSAGLIAGLLCLVKPQYALLCVWGLVRKEWRFATAAAAVVVAGLAVSVVLFGWHHHADYLPTLAHIGARGEAFSPNQSVNGLLNRWLQNGEILRFTKDQLAPYHRVVHWGTLATSVLLIGACLVPRKRGKEAGPVGLGIVILTATMAAPIAWEHHYGVLMPLYALVLPALVKRRIWGAATLPALAASFVLSANYFSCFDALAPSRWNFLMSYLFLGALILLMLMYGLEGRGPEGTAALRGEEERGIR